MNKTMNDIYLRRASKIVLDSCRGKTDTKLIATAMKNIESIGFTLSKEAVEALAKYGDTRFSEFYKDLVGNLRKMIGANRKFNPMYPNFPQQVMDASDAELYINAILHYFGDWVGLRILPDYEAFKRSPIVEKTTLTVIGIGSDDDFASIMKNLISSKTSISETDKSDLGEFLLENNADLKKVLPTVIPNKEVLAFVAKSAINMGINPDVISPYFKTATDVLRLAVALSDGDISLAKPTKFRNFSRPERRFLVSLIDKSGKFEQITEDMLRFKGYWKKLGEKLHFGDYSQFKGVNKAIDILRNDKEFHTTNSKIEKALSENDIKGALAVLIYRPGDMARRLDQMLRQRKNMTLVVRSFESVVEKVSNPVLFQLIAHFKNRTCDGNRVVLPKGNIAKLQLVPKMVGEITKVLCNRIVRICQNELKVRYAKLGTLGNVYVDKELKGYLIPFSQRSASRALKTIVRGSRVKMDGKNFIRFFLWWKEPQGDRIDVDLSASFYGWNFKILSDITYYNLRNNFGTHSGDITSAPNGACEFIDIDVAKAKKAGVRYIVQSIYSYTQQKYYDIPECFAGYMTRDDSQKGKIFDARTVQNKYDLTSDNQTVIPMIFDLETNEMIWADLGTEKIRSVNNAHSNRGTLNDAVKGIIEMKKANLLDLFGLHASARGQLVDKPEDADTVFTVDPSNITIKDGAKVITPFDIEAIMGQYL